MIATHADAWECPAYSVVWPAFKATADTQVCQGLIAIARDSVRDLREPCASASGESLTCLPNSERDTFALRLQPRPEDTASRLCRLWAPLRRPSRCADGRNAPRALPVCFPNAPGETTSAENARLAYALRNCRASPVLSYAARQTFLGAPMADVPSLSIFPPAKPVTARLPAAANQIVGAILFFAAYLALDKISYLDAPRPFAVMAWNPALGVCVAVALLWGRRALPLVFLAQFLAALLSVAATSCSRACRRCVAARL